MSKRRHAVPLIVCFALALGFRVVRRSSELLSSDAADLASDVSGLLCSSKSFLEHVQALALFRLGGVQPVVVFLHGLMARTLDIPLEPTTWEWSTILVSCATSPLAFLVGRQFGGVVSGWAWAFFLAVSPIHVMLGRNLGAPWAYEIGFQLALLWLVDRHLQDASSSRGAVLGCLLAAYFWCGNQMMAILPVLGFAVLACAFGQSKGERVPFLRRKLLTPWALVPLTSAAVLCYCTFVLHEGHLYHALFEKKKEAGWYWENFYSDLIHNLGYVPTWLSFVALFCALLVRQPLLDRRRIPLVYALCYSLPFVFLVGRATTLTRGYCVYGITGLLGLVALVPTNLQAISHRFESGAASLIRQVGQAVVLASTALMLLAAAGASAYKLYPNQSFLGVKGFQGSFGRPIGAAAAASYIARVAGSRPGAHSGRVFSDAYGGTGLEPPIMRLYFTRPSFAHYDAPRMAPWKAFAPRAAEVGFAVIRPENASLVDRYFPGLKLAARVVPDGQEEPILLVYARDFEKSPVVLSVEEGRSDYAATLTHFCAR